ncbi:MAG: gamma-glutamylcyclotransferase [Thermodesulfobacteriota bacterium]
MNRSCPTKSPPGVAVYLSVLVVAFSGCVALKAGTGGATGEKETLTEGLGITGTPTASPSRLGNHPVQAANKGTGRGTAEEQRPTRNSDRDLTADPRNSVARNFSEEGQFGHLVSMPQKFLSSHRSEERQAREHAVKLAAELGDVREIKLCYEWEGQEWWISLYEENGPFFEVRQYTWNAYRQSPQVLLVQEKIPKESLERHLREHSWGMKCQVLAPPALKRWVAKPVDADGAASIKRSTPSISPVKKAALTGARSPVSAPEINLQTVTSGKTGPGAAALATTSTPRKVPPTVAGLDKKRAPARTEMAGRAPSAVKPAAQAGARASDRSALREPSEALPRLASASPSDPKPASAHSQLHPAEDRSTANIGLSVALTGAGKSSSKRTPSYYVFAYGSNMNHTDLLAWLEDNGYDSSLVIAVTPGVLSGYDFVWNFYSASRGGGAVNIEPKRDSTIWGLLVEIEDPLLKAFDQREGHPSVYSRGEQRVPVRRVSDGKTVFAWLYRAKPNRYGRRDIWPTPQYKRKIVEAARFWDLPREYVHKIESWKTQ